MALASAIALAFAAPEAAADPPPPAAPPAEPQPGPATPDEVSGVERPERPAGAPASAVWNTVLWLPRSAIDLVFLTTGTAGSLIENEQIVPRARDFFFTSSGSFGVFPTLFMETGMTANAGARMMIKADPVASTIRGGYGGPDMNVVEGRAHVVTSVPVPLVVTMEGLHDRRTGRGFLGVGQTPESDPRNQFVAEPSVGIYRERRERAILSFGVRPLPKLEVILSSSYTQRFTDDPPNVGVMGLGGVFAPASIAGAYRETRSVYTEAVLRYDSRANWRGEASGELLEGYAGWAHSVSGERIEYARYGVRGGLFLPFIRPTTILSPTITLDTMTAPESAMVPFTDLVGQPMFRGFNNRRDYVSLVGSLDYRWFVSRFVAGRIFADAAHVYPSFKDFTFQRTRWAAGCGVDLHTSTTQLGRLAIAFSPEGFYFLFALGVYAGYGDRQHRD